LVVDNFGIKYVGKEHAQHLLDCLQEIYTVTTDWFGTKYCGLTLTWDYDAATVQLSMPGYVAKALHRFQHPTPTKPEFSPHKWSALVYTSAPQLVTAPDTSRELTSAESLRLQEVVGTLLYYAHAIGCTMLVALGSIAAAKTTKDTAQSITQLLNYAATNPDAVIEYKRSDMVLHVHSDASFQSESQARSRSGGYFFLSSGAPHHTSHIVPTAEPPPENGPVHVPSTILKVQRRRSQTRRLILQCQRRRRLHTTLEATGHP
jgi:hypothetical protein